MDERDPRYLGTHGPAAITAVSHSGYRAAQRVIEAGGLRGVMPVMGMRLFYGRRRDGQGVIEFSMTNRAFAAAEARARELCDLLWDGYLTGPSYEVYGVELAVTGRVDLSPAESLVHAVRWGHALGML